MSSNPAIAQQPFEQGADGHGLPPERPHEAALWHRFRHEGDAQARGMLIETYLDFARIMAGRTYAQRHESAVAFNEYMQLASVGLIEAIDRYVPTEGGASFRTYAAHWIRGSILNGLRHLSEVHAQIEARKRVHRDRLHSLARRAKAAPDESEAAADAEAGNEEESDAFARLAGVAMGVALGFMLDDLRIYRSSEGAVEDNCLHDIDMRKMRASLAQAVRNLPSRERTLITQHYFDGMPFEEMAQAWTLSRGRVSQLHKQALMSLRAALGRAGLGDWSI